MKNNLFRYGWNGVRDKGGCDKVYDTEDDKVADSDVVDMISKV